MLFEVKRTIVGQDVLLERMAIAMLAGGHLLVEGVPGLAKTLAVKSLAGAIGGQFQRIQFAGDLVPADLVGTRVYHQRTGEFEVSLGPVFTNLLLADEIDAHRPKVQSALLEVMQEQQVTIGRETFRLPEPLLVMATQNPIESDGTLSAARGAGRPIHDEGARELSDLAGGARDRRAGSAAGGSAAGDAQPGRPDPDAGQRRAGLVDPAVVDYAVRLVAATRSPEEVGQGDLERYVTYGASPRATIALVLGGRALALSLRGRDSYSPTTSTKWLSTYCATGSCCHTRRWLTTSMPTAS